MLTRLGTDHSISGGGLDFFNVFAILMLNMEIRVYVRTAIYASALR